MWEVAFVETRCAGILGGSGRVGWGVQGWGLFHFGHQYTPSLPSLFLWRLFPPFSSLQLPPLSSYALGPGGREEGVP